MRVLYSMMLSIFILLGSGGSGLAWDHPAILLNTRVIVNQPDLIRLSSDWQIHLDRYTSIYEFSKKSNSYAELRSILGREELTLYKTLKVSSNGELSAFLKKFIPKRSFAFLDTSQKKWTVVKNQDESIDIAMRNYSSDENSKVFYRFKKNDSQYPVIESLVGPIELNSRREIPPLFTDPRFDQLFTPGRVIYSLK